MNKINNINEVNTRKPIFSNDFLNILGTFIFSSFITFLPIIGKCVPVVFNSTGVGDIKNIFFGSLDVFIALGSMIVSAILVKKATRGRCIVYNIIWFLCILCGILNLVCYWNLGEKYSVGLAFKWFLISLLLSLSVVIMSQYIPRKEKGSNDNA